jgi:uncharacterized protein (DUF2147 family)
MYIRWLAGFMLLLSSGFVFAKASVDGLWEAYYVDTTIKSAEVRITTLPNGELKGVIEKNFPRAGGDQSPNCIHCKGADKDKPFIGLTILWGMKPDSQNPNHWSGGKILNAANGDIYTAEATLSSDGKTLDLRGYVLNPMFGKTATWNRIK